MTQNITFRKMTEDEYNIWIEQSISDYAMSLITSGQYSSEIEAKQQADKDFHSFLKDGLSTPNHTLLVAENVDGIPIGMIWYETGDPNRAFIADFVVYDEYRRMGYGTAILAELERILIGKKPCIVLHVFEYNTAAINLYKKCGFVIAKSDNGSIYMEKFLK